MSGSASISRPVSEVIGRAVVVRGNDIDTDLIIPARFMKVVTFDGLGEFAFYDQRYAEDGTPKPHPFNEERYRGASILIANRNFGCGSSREHAPQALMRSGINAVVGESFAEIFAGNCTAMGIPTPRLPSEAIHEIMDCVEADPSVEIRIDLPSSTLTMAGRSYPFDMPPAYRSALIAGSWDSTSTLLANLDAIETRASQIPYLAGFGA